METALIAAMKICVLFASRTLEEPANFHGCIESCLVQVTVTKVAGLSRRSKLPAAGDSATEESADESMQVHFTAYLSQACQRLFQQPQWRQGLATMLFAAGFV
jgi:hypothetical protein